MGKVPGDTEKYPCPPLGNQPPLSTVVVGEDGEIRLLEPLASSSISNLSGAPSRCYPVDQGMHMRRYEHCLCPAGRLTDEQPVAHRHSYTIADFCNSMGLTLFRLGFCDIFSFILNLDVQFLHGLLDYL